jgi:hypothetical protein
LKYELIDPKPLLEAGDAKARKSFATRHNCKEKLKKGDETTAGYWSCRAPTSKTGGVW